MIKGIIFDLGGTLMYFEGQWEEVDKQSTAALVAFLNDSGIQVGDDFHARFLEQRVGSRETVIAVRIVGGEQ